MKILAAMLILLIAFPLIAVEQRDVNFSQFIMEECAAEVFKKTGVWTTAQQNKRIKEDMIDVMQRKRNFDMRGYDFYYRKYLKVCPKTIRIFHETLLDMIK